MQLNDVAYLQLLGERVRTLRAQRGLTRKALAASAGVSERHLANLEGGEGNASVLFLRQLATALDCELDELLPEEAENKEAENKGADSEEAESASERTLIRQLLKGRTAQALQQARLGMVKLLEPQAAAWAAQKSQRIALVGLRGAGKSTLGLALAQKLGIPFVELNRQIEALAGCDLNAIHAQGGSSAYRRFERAALDAVLAAHSRVVIATPGGIVADAAAYNQLLASCTTVWVQASPEEHMARVLAQGDTRPMAGNRTAMMDLRRILQGRTAFYAKADACLSTSQKNISKSLEELLNLLNLN